LLFIGIAACHALYFDCVYNRDGPYKSVGITYICDAQVLDTNVTDTVRAVGKNHASGYSNTHVKGLRIIDANLPIFPKEIEKFFPNLQIISIFRSNLANISASDLKPFVNLMYLFLDDNKLQALDGNLFENTPHLKKISFDNNNLVFVGGNILNPLRSLTNAFFFGNRCVSRYVFSASDLPLLKRDFETKCWDKTQIKKVMH
jgi:hypothetical protein